MANIVTQYGNQVVRATDGAIQCVEERSEGRLVCLFDGAGEMLVENDQGLFVVQLTGGDPHALHVYEAGDLSCGLEADF